MGRLAFLLLWAGCAGSGDPAGPRPTAPGLPPPVAGEGRSIVEPDLLPEPDVQGRFERPLTERPPPSISRLPSETGEVWFEEVSAAAGVAFDRTPADGYLSVVDRMAGGVCIIDVDGVPPLDLFFAMRPAGTTRSRLFVAGAPWSYADQTDMRGLDDVGDAVGCLAFDADGDRDDDLLVTGLGSLRLFHNVEGLFVDRTDLLGFTPYSLDMYTSAAAGDIDGDRDLDLLVAGFLRYDIGDRAGRRCGAGPCEAFIYGFPKIPDLLFVRGDDGRYREMAAVLAPELLAPEPGLAVSLSDVDGDREIDMYIGNDLGATYYDRVLSRLGDGRYYDHADEVGLSFNRHLFGIDTMGFSSGDLNGDTTLDHVVTSFEMDATAVFVCGFDGSCEDLADTMGTMAARYSLRWGAALVDLDLDGWNDLVEATGHYHDDAEIIEIGFRRPCAQPANLLRNRGDGTLEIPPLAARDGTRVARQSRGLAVADLDDDGDMDVVLAPASGPVGLLRNVAERRGHFLRVVLAGRSPNTPAAGARVEITRGGARWVREQRIGEGYLGNFDARLHFGVPGEAPVDVTVRWPSGLVTDHPAVAIDGEIVLTEPAVP